MFQTQKGDLAVARTTSVDYQGFVFFKPRPSRAHRTVFSQCFAILAFAVSFVFSYLNTTKAQPTPPCCPDTCSAHGPGKNTTSGRRFQCQYVMVAVAKCEQWGKNVIRWSCQRKRTEQRPNLFCNRNPSSPQRLTQHLQTRGTRPTQGCSARLDFRSHVDNKHYATTVPQRLERVKVQFWSIIINSSCGKVRLNLWTKNVATASRWETCKKTMHANILEGPAEKNTIVVDAAETPCRGTNCFSPAFNINTASCAKPGKQTATTKW